MLAFILAVALAGSPPSKLKEESPAPPKTPADLCGTRCYCNEAVRPRICFCQKPTLPDTEIIFVDVIKFYAPDGGVSDVKP